MAKVSPIRARESDLDGLTSGSPVARGGHDSDVPPRSGPLRAFLRIDLLVVLCGCSRSWRDRTAVVKGDML